MKLFQGFPTGKTRLVPIPSAFFTDVLPEVDDLNTLKVMLHIFRALDAQEGTIRYLRVKDLMQDELLLASFGQTETDRQFVLVTALQKAVDLGFALRAVNAGEADADLLFLNSQRGREALTGLQAGTWKPDDVDGATYQLAPVWPGIFRLYEDNIGPLTPMLADILQEAEKNYPQSIIQFAFEEAVKKNARNWKYIDAILRNWQEKGSNGQNSRDTEKDRRKFFEGEYAEFINLE